MIADLAAQLETKGWEFMLRGDTVSARRRDWPAQLEVRLDLSAEQATSLALSIDLRTMPLRGERFREILNDSREDILEPLGSFTVRQLLDDGTWERDISHGAFLHGMHGLSRHADLVLFERPVAESDQDLGVRYANAIHRLSEVGNQIGVVLQRLYQRTVLTAIGMTEVVPHVMRSAQCAPFAVESAAGDYPWRR